jgi:hypothetical protein
MPLQIIGVIIFLKNLHHKLLIEVIKNLPIHCIFQFILCPILDGIPKRKYIFKL